MVDIGVDGSVGVVVLVLEWYHIRRPKRIVDLLRIIISPILFTVYVLALSYPLFPSLFECREWFQNFVFSRLALQY